MMICTNINSWLSINFEHRYLRHPWEVPSVSTKEKQNFHRVFCWFFNCELLPQSFGHILNIFWRAKNPGILFFPFFEARKNWSHMLNCDSTSFSHLETTQATKDLPNLIINTVAIKSYLVVFCLRWQFSSKWNNYVFLPPDTMWTYNMNSKTVFVSQNFVTQHTFNVDWLFMHPFCMHFANF